MEQVKGPIITLVFSDALPGADPETVERNRKWMMEVYTPMSMKLPGLLGLDYYRIIHESLEYPLFGSVLHYKNLKDRETYMTAPESQAISKDAITWDTRGVLDPVWGEVYELVKSFRDGSNVSEKPSTLIENAPTMSFEAFRIDPKDEDRYVKWFEEIGTSLIPLFFKLSGFKGYDWYKDTGLHGNRDLREDDYPKFLSVIYFTDFLRQKRAQELSLKIGYEYYPAGA